MPEQLRRVCAHRSAVPGLPSTVSPRSAFSITADLIGSDHPCLRMPSSDRTRLGERQPGHQSEGAFVSRPRLIDAGRFAPKGFAHPREQRASVARGRCQNELRRRLQKQRLAPNVLLTGVGSSPIIRGPWQRACRTLSIAHAWQRKPRCWSVPTSCAICPGSRSCSRSRKASSMRVLLSRQLPSGRSGAHVEVRAAPTADLPALHAGIRLRRAGRKRCGVCGR